MATEHDLAAQLLRRACEDEAAAKAMLPIEGVADVIVCFHAQQAVEKALKAMLATHRVEFEHTHDLRVLIGRCESNGLPLPDELAEVDLLSPYAAKFRYDDDEVCAVARKTALSWATAAVQWGRQQIESEERAEDSGSDTVSHR
jgi:HEPN domain-containing protein